MDQILYRLKEMARRSGGFLSELRDHVASDDPLIILPYRGYAHAERVFVSGRVIENHGLFDGKSDSQFRNIIDNIRRFNTDEIANAVVRLEFLGQHFDAVTDHEGYFYIDERFSGKLPDQRYAIAQVTLIEPAGPEALVPQHVRIYTCQPTARYGIISDIDDTIMQTHVSSLFRLKMLYETFIRDGHQRLPMEGMVELMNELATVNGEYVNPVFYVSHSPWNLYDLLIEFLEVRGFPDGPLKLRDFGLKPSGEFKRHKEHAISHIMEMYPELKFIMLGDTGSEDADVYIDFAKKFSGRVLAIYIRHTKDTKNATRVAGLIKEAVDVPVISIKKADEILAHSRSAGFMN